MSWNFNRWSRKLHRWGALITCLPLLLVIVTGIFLQVKKQVSWVQPPTQRGTPGDPGITWDEVLASTSAIAEAEVKTWEDVDRLDVRPGKGIVKVQCNNRWEVQIDLKDGTVLSSTYRRSDLIESLHDGSFFADAAKLWLFLPNGLILLGLWFTGIYLWWLPHGARRKKRRKRQNAPPGQKTDS
ncbi:MAG: PepSY-associated TM helix domain-containing protein [Planctomycetota bacterium]